MVLKVGWGFVEEWQMARLRNILYSFERMLRLELGLSLGSFAVFS